MDTARLKLIIRTVRDDWQALDLQRRFKALINAINSQMQGPNEEHQRQIVSTFNDLKDALTGSALNNIPQTWRTTLEELGVLPFVGRALKQRIEAAFEPSSAILVNGRDEFTQIRDRIAQMMEAFTKLLDGMNALGIPDASLAAGEGEVSVLVPRVAVSNELGKLAKEATFFDQTLRFFSELSTGSREAPKIKSLSTTDPLFLLTVSPTIAAAVIFAVDQILDLIEKTYKLRKLRAEARSAEADAEIISAIEKQAVTKIEKGLIDIEKLLLARYGAVQRPAGRGAELTTEAHKVVSGLARRIDHGYQVDADAAPPEPPKTEDTENAEGGTHGSTQVQQVSAAVVEVKQLSSRVRYTELEPEPVLNLPAPTTEEN